MEIGKKAAIGVWTYDDGDISTYVWLEQRRQEFSPHLLLKDKTWKSPARVSVQGKRHGTQH